MWTNPEEIKNNRDDGDHSNVNNANSSNGIGSNIVDDIHGFHPYGAQSDN
jgi:hypothetical protein